MTLSALILGLTFLAVIALLLTAACSRAHGVAQDEHDHRERRP